MSTTSHDAVAPSADVSTVSVEISGMSCGHCVAAVRSALDTVSGVRDEQVAVGSAHFAIDPAAGTPDAITAAAVQAIRDAGYDARVTSSRARSSSGPSRRAAGLPMMDSCCCGPRHS